MVSFALVSHSVLFVLSSLHCIRTCHSPIVICYIALHFVEWRHHKVKQPTIVQHTTVCLNGTEKRKKNKWCGRAMIELQFWIFHLRWKFHLESIFTWKTYFCPIYCQISNELRLNFTKKNVVILHVNFNDHLITIPHAKARSMCKQKVHSRSCSLFAF